MMLRNRVRAIDSPISEHPRRRMEVLCGGGLRRLTKLFRRRTFWKPARVDDGDDDQQGMEMKERKKGAKVTETLFREHAGDTTGEGRSLLRTFRLPSGMEEDDDYFLWNNPDEIFTADRGIQVNVRRAPRCLFNKNEYDF